MAKDDHWLNLTDDDEEKDARTHLCFMVKREEAYNADEDDHLSIDSETTSEVHSNHFIDFEEQMNEMMFKIQEFEGKLKKERNLVNYLENKLKCEHDFVLKFSL